MKQRVILAIFVLVALLDLASAANPPQPKFSLLVRPSETGVQLVCQSGCAWKTLQADCPEAPCEFRVDEFGLQGKPPSAEDVARTRR